MKESGFSNEVRDAIKNNYKLVIDDVFLDNEIYHRID